MTLPPAATDADVRRLKAVTRAEPDALARVLMLLETQRMVPSRIGARRTPILGCGKFVLEIEIELGAADLSSDEFHRLVRIMTELRTVLSAVVADSVETLIVTADDEASS